MKKYLILYTLGFTLLIAGSINLTFELASFDFNVYPSQDELTTREVEYDITELIVDGSFHSYYKYEIDETLEDNIVIIQASAIGEVDFHINQSVSYSYQNNKQEISSKSFWIESKSFRPFRYLDSIISQLKNKKIYSEEYQFNRYKIKLYMNSETAKKYVR